MLRGLGLIQESTQHAAPAEERSNTAELILPLFYIDPLDHPEHVPAVEEAIVVAAGMGEPAIPILIQNLEAGDVKAQMAMAQALGRMGATAVDPLLAEYESTCPDPACRAFLLYALGKVRSPEIVRAAPLALEAAGIARPGAARHRHARDRQVRRDRSRPAGCRTSLRRRSSGGCANLADASPGIRAKAVRSLGKLARYGHLTTDRSGQLQA